MHHVPTRSLLSSTLLYIWLQVTTIVTTIRICTHQVIPKAGLFVEFLLVRQDGLLPPLTEAGRGADTRDGLHMGAMGNELW